MMKKFLCLLLSLLCLSGCTAQPAAAPSPAPDAAVTAPEDGPCVNRAMYIALGDGHLMIDEAGQVYTVRFPQDITGADGSSITPAELVSGNILEIHGDGIMLESYPGQYPNVTRIRVLDPGDPADIEPHRELIDSLYTVPAPLDAPPALHLEHTAAETIALTQIRPGNYHWEVPMEGGTAAQLACGAHVLQSRELPVLSMDAPADLLLTFPDYAPDTVTCIRWPVSERKPDGSEITAAGENVQFILPVEAAGAEGSFPASLRKLPAEPGYVYCVTARWPEGQAEYGFVTE